MINYALFAGRKFVMHVQAADVSNARDQLRALGEAILQLNNRPLKLKVIINRTDPDNIMMEVVTRNHPLKMVTFTLKKQT